MLIAAIYVQDYSIDLLDLLDLLLLILLFLLVPSCTSRGVLGDGLGECRMSGYWFWLPVHRQC